MKRILSATAVVLGAAAFFQSAEALQPELGVTAAASPAFESSVSAALFAAPLTAPPPPMIGVGTSVQPPSPGPGQQCSITTPGDCSVTAPGTRCSAANDNGNQCSTFGPDIGRCSAIGPSTICSVLPPSFGANPSTCSTYSQTVNHDCSALLSGNARCSAKSSGLSQCSTHQAFPTNGDQRCSVLNSGGTTNSYCSTKFNMPLPAKGCSTFISNSQCSVIDDGKGRCTTFGAADPASCSVQAPGGLCSIMPAGPMGNPCIQ